MADIRVEVRAAGGELVLTSYSDGAGMFHISQVPPGSYEVVAIKGINDARERVQVAGMETNVDLRMQVQTTVSDGSTSVSVAQFKVPDRARKLYLKGNEPCKKTNWTTRRNMQKRPWRFIHPSRRH